MTSQSKTNKSSNFINALLYSTESITALLFSVVTISLIARHFGPEALARFSLAQSISTIFLVFSTLGFEQFIIKHLARNENDPAFITTMLFGMLGGWFVYALFVAGYYLLFNDFEKDFFLIVTVVLSTLLLRVFFLKVYLQARHLPKPIALASFLSRVFSLFYLLFGTSLNFSFELMMLYLPLQALLLNVIMLIKVPIFLTQIRISQFKFNILVDTFKQSSPLILSIFIYYFYSQADIVIMSHLLEAKEVGTYSAAQRLIPQAAFIAYVMVTTFYKELDHRLINNKQSFEQLVLSLLTIQFTIGIGLSLVVYIFAKLIIILLYGNQYIDSIAILQTVCWAWIFIMPAALYSRLLIMLDLVKYELFKMFIVAPIIIALYYYSILEMGSKGAALTYLFAFFFVDFGIYFAFKKTRPLAMMGLRAMSNIFIHPLENLKLTFKIFREKSN